MRMTSKHDCAEIYMVYTHAGVSIIRRGKDPCGEIQARGIILAHNDRKGNREWIAKLFGISPKQVHWPK